MVSFCDPQKSVDMNFKVDNIWAPELCLHAIYNLHCVCMHGLHKDDFSFSHILYFTPFVQIPAELHEKHSPQYIQVAPFLWFLWTDCETFSRYDWFICMPWVRLGIFIVIYGLQVRKWKTPLLTDVTEFCQPITVEIMLEL